MVIAYFENGYGLSKNGTLTNDFLVVEQVSSNSFVIKNSRGEVIISNFYKAEKACRYAEKASLVYKLF